MSSPILSPAEPRAPVAPKMVTVGYWSYLVTAGGLLGQREFFAQERGLPSLGETTTSDNEDTILTWS